MISGNAVANAAQILSSRRTAALTQAADRRTEIYAALPELYRLDAEYFALLTAADSDAAERLPALGKRKSALLAQGGFTPDDLLPHYTCPKCEDTGYLDGRRCACFEALIRAEAGKSLPAGLSSRCGFAQFRLDCYSDHAENGQPSPRAVMAEISAQCARYAEEFTTHSESLLFVGAPGLGKTHLSVAIACRVLEKGFGVLYVTAQGLMDCYERIRFDRAPTDSDRATAALATGTDLLIIDDLGAEFITQFSQSVLYNVLNERIVAGLPTITSTNRTAEELAACYAERITSRLFSFRPYLFAGRDLRLTRGATMRA